MEGPSGAGSHGRQGRAGKEAGVTGQQRAFGEDLGESFSWELAGGAADSCRGLGKAECSDLELPLG